MSVYKSLAIEVSELEELAELLLRVAKLASCWCTEPKYWKNEEPTKCLRCVAIDRANEWLNARELAGLRVEDTSKPDKTDMPHHSM